MSGVLVYECDQCGMRAEARTTRGFLFDDAGKPKGWIGAFTKTFCSWDCTGVYVEAQRTGESS